MPTIVTNLVMAVECRILAAMCPLQTVVTTPSQLFVIHRRERPRTIIGMLLRRPLAYTLFITKCGFIDCLRPIRPCFPEPCPRSDGQLLCLASRMLNPIYLL